MRRPLLIVLEVQRLFKALDSAAEVAQFDEDLCFLVKNLWYCLVVEDDFVEEYKSRFKFVVFQRLFGTLQLLEYFVLLNPAVVVFLLHINPEINCLPWPVGYVPHPCWFELHHYNFSYFQQKTCKDLLRLIFDF